MNIRIFVGMGGVGKTSVTAASALLAAAAGRKSLVLTVDPALRLKTALGMTGAAPQQRVPLETGELHAALLDVKTTLDRMVREHAGANAQKILDHPIYSLLITSLAGMNELVAVERIHQAMSDGFESIFIDTAPSRHTFEFLDKPEYFSDLVSVPFVKIIGRTWNLWKKSPLSRHDAGSTDLYSRLQDLVGANLVTQVLDFFSLFHEVAEGYGQRARKTIAILRDPRTTAFTIVTTASGARRDGNYLYTELTKRKYHVEALIVNRLWPELRVHPSGAARADVRELAAWCESLAAEQRGFRDKVHATWSAKGLRVTDLPELREVDGLAALQEIAAHLTMKL
jgi:anion-transporting  ArsA/GET3 family ATPase